MVYLSVHVRSCLVGAQSWYSAERFGFSVNETIIILIKTFINDSAY